MSQDTPRTSFTTASLAERVGGALTGSGTVVIEGVNALDEAGDRELTFVADRAHARRWGESRAAAAIVAESVLADLGEADGRPLIVVPNVEVAMVAVLAAFAPPPVQPEPGIDPTASVQPDARMGEGVRIGPHVSVGPGVVIGDRVTVHAGVRIYAGVQIGSESVLHANCVVRERCWIGRKVVLHQAVSIGADGFGYVPGEDGRRLLKVPQIGTVRIEDEVEIGANSCVDRGKFGQTVIGQGTKLDNLVQVAHNCRIGRWCVIAGQVGLAGSVQIGDWVQIGGAVGIADHVRVGDRARIGAKSGVHRSIPPGETWLGYPAAPASQQLRQWSSIRKLPALVQASHGPANAGER